MLVPAPVQQQIVEQVPPLVAYVPSRLAPGWHYASWTTTGKALMIFFRNGAGKEVQFLVKPYGGTCGFSEDKTFQMAGIKTFYSHNAAQQQAWRCVNGVKVSAATLLPPNRFADVGLARLVASGRRLRR
jgi:hypothetical protein